MCVGYLYVFGFLNWLKVNNATVKTWEKRWPFSTYKSSPSFAETTSAQENEP